MVYAPRGVGKTWFALALAYAVASGGDFLSFSAPVPKRVVYVDGEMPGSVIQARLSSIVEGAGKEPPAPEYLKFLAADLHRDGLPDLSTLEGQAAFEPFFAEADLIVIDNLSTVMRNGRENEADSWIPIQEWALRMRRQGRSVVFVHHAGKGGAQRGTSKREDVLDTVIKLNRPSDYEPEQGARFELHFEKARGLTGDDVSPLEITLREVDGAAVWRHEPVANADLQRVVTLKGDGLTDREIATELEMSKSRVNRLVQKARMEGLIDG